MDSNWRLGTGNWELKPKYTVPLPALTRTSETCNKGPNGSTVRNALPGQPEALRGIYYQS